MPGCRRVDFASQRAVDWEAVNISSSVFDRLGLTSTWIGFWPGYWDYASAIFPAAHCGTPWQELVRSFLPDYHAEFEVELILWLQYYQYTQQRTNILVVKVTNCPWWSDAGWGLRHMTPNRKMVVVKQLTVFRG
jgi:hypothetical protein